MGDQPTLMPPDTPDYMVDAWASCMSWAISHQPTLDAYRAETGDNWAPGQTGLERMVDEACGADAAFCERFIRWANVAVWGPMDGGEDG